jgi:divinyl chlorophyllide a 8-vinyl-reductase
VISCLASRTGAPKDAWAIDHRANSLALAAAIAADIPRFVLLSAICVQKPLLEFQRAKLAFEAELQAEAIKWSIVRPTAFFKSLSGQVARVQAGRPFLVFGDGRLTACKPISDADLGRYLVACLTDPALENRVLPIGGPGPAITPLDQAQMLERLTGQPVRLKRVPVALMDGIIAVLSALGRLSPKLTEKTNLARIGRYYATESMLVLNPATGQYEADATPEFGTDRLADHYAAMLNGTARDDRGAHKVF